MSVTPGPVGDAVLHPERTLGHGPRVEDGVHVPDEQRPRTVGPPIERGDDRRAEAARRVRPRLDRRPELRRGSSATQRPTSSTPAGRVVAAVDVDQALEVGEVRRQVGDDGSPQAVELGRRTGAAGWRSSGS